MLNGWYRGQKIGSGTNTISMSEQLRAGEITLEEFHEAEGAMSRSAGHCMTMGTASTMASLVEALGVGLPQNAAIPAPDARRNELARLAGRRIVQMVKDDIRLSHILTRKAFENGIRTLADNVARAKCFNRGVIRTYDAPFKPEAGIAILRGNLCPGGAVIKPLAVSVHLMTHTRRAVVFESIEDLHARINDDALDITADCIMVLKNCGPKGYPGMAEAGNMPLPPKLLRSGVKDRIRMSDARMPGTADGTVALHVVPEAAAGGALALVQNGDQITIDVPGDRPHLHVDDAELAAPSGRHHPR